MADRAGLKILLRLFLFSLGYTFFPRIQALPLILARFLTYACTLRICLEFNSLRALGLGVDLEDPKFIRDSFYLAALVVFFIFLFNAGGVLWIISNPGLDDFRDPGLNFNPG